MWFAILRPFPGVEMPSVVFNSGNQPVGFAFFTSEEMLEENLLGRTKLDFEALLLGKSATVKAYISLCAEFYTRICMDWEVGFDTAMAKTPVYINPQTTHADGEEPAYNNLIQFLKANFMNCVGDEMEYKELIKQNGCTIALSEHPSEHDYSAIVKEGEFDTVEQMCGSKNAMYFTEICASREDAINECSRWIHNRGCPESQP